MSGGIGAGNAYPGRREVGRVRPRGPERIKAMPTSCEDYRDFQRLLALKRKLAESGPDPEEREEIESLIQELEKKLKMENGSSPN